MLSHCLLDAQRSEPLARDGIVVEEGFRDVCYAQISLCIARYERVPPRRELGVRVVNVCRMPSSARVDRIIMRSRLTWLGVVLPPPALAVWQRLRRTRRRCLHFGIRVVERPELAPDPSRYAVPRRNEEDVNDPTCAVPSRETEDIGETAAPWDVEAERQARKEHCGGDG